MKFSKMMFASALAAAAFAIPATAQTASPAAKVVVGAAVSDTAGNAVGTIEEVSGDLAVLSTGTHKVSLPISSFGAGEKGPVLAMTKAEVDAAASGAAAANQAELVASITKGAEVTDTAGAKVGTIEAVEGEFATIATTNCKVRLPISAFAKGANGPVIAMSAAELDAAAKSAAAPTAKN
jgi:Cu/Zn superoxide dismutase